MVNSHFDSLKPRVIDMGVSKRVSVGSIEAQLRFTFPADLRYILEKFQGAIGFDTMIGFKPFKNTGFENREGFLGFEIFYGLNEDVWAISKNFRIVDAPELEHLFAIGEGPGGDKICLSRRDSGVYFWKHDLSNYGATEVAKNFEDFLDILEVRENFNKENLGIDESKTWISL